MPTLEKITLSARELSDLRKIQDNYVSEKKTQEEKLRARLEAFWSEVRAEHNLDDVPFHVMGSDLWLIKDATKEEQEAFINMTRYK